MAAFKRNYIFPVMLFTCFFFCFSAEAVVLKAGTAKGEITPAQKKGRVLVMGNESQGVMDSINARVLTLFDGKKRLVLVSYDLNCLDVATPILRVRCRDELGIDPAYLVLMATHNHGAPIQIVPDNFDYGNWLADRIFELIEEAIADESGPARVWFGSGRGMFLYATGGHSVDQEIQLIKVNIGEETKAVLFNHATHPMQASFWRIEPGHPGHAMDYIEKKVPGAVALYTDACGGNQFPWLGFTMLSPRPAVRILGKAVGRKALRISRGELVEVTGEIWSSLEVIPLPLAPPITYEEALALAEEEGVDMDLGFVPYPHPQRKYNWIRNLVRHYEKDIPFPEVTTDRVCTDDGFLVRELPKPREYPCYYEETIVARIGPLLFVSMQGEVTAPIGKAIKDRYGNAPLWVSAYMGEHNLYIPTKKLVEKDAYQSRVIRIQYASPVGWSTEVEKEMVEGVSHMIDNALTQ